MSGSNCCFLTCIQISQEVEEFSIVCCDPHSQRLSAGGGLVVKSCPTLATQWTIACQAPLFMGFSRQEYWNGLPFPSPGEAKALV